MVTEQTLPTPQLAPVSFGGRLKKADLMVEEIKRWIASGQLRPGDRLPKALELQAHFGLSRGSTREALKSLEVQGLISMQTGPDGGGTITEVPFRVAFPLVQNHIFFQGIDLKSIYELRRAIEPELAASAVPHLTDDQILRLEKSICKCTPVPASAEQALAQRTDDLEFHDILAEASPNSLLRFNCRMISQMLRSMIVFKAGADAMEQHGHALGRANLVAHQDILSAIRQRDADLVRKLMYDHIVEAEQLVSHLAAKVENRLILDFEMAEPVPLPKRQVRSGQGRDA